MQLTEQQKQAIEQGEAVSVTVEQTECVVLRKDLYERAKPFLENDQSNGTDEERSTILSPPTPDEVQSMQPLLADLDPEDWEDASVYESAP